MKRLEFTLFLHSTEQGFMSIQSAPNFDSLPDAAYAREAQIISKPGRPGVLPFSSATLWRKVNAGEFPKPVKLSERVTAWQVGAVRAWLQSRAAA